MDLKDWFDGLTAERVRAMVGEEETERMDCKRLVEDKAGAQLAEVVSGFANSDGGVCLWGVDARKNDKGIDCITNFPGMDDPKRSASRLNELGPQAVSPPVPGVVHRALLDPDGRGFIATYVPASDEGPHMARYGHDQYVQRNGQSFRAMSHWQVADMFGRRARPVLRVRAHYESPTLMPIMVDNTGRGPAIAPYLQIDIEIPFERSEFFTNQMEIVRHDSAISWMHGEGTDFVIHPGTSLKVGGLKLPSPRVLVSEGRFPAECVIRYKVGALHAMATDGVIRFAVPRPAQS